MSRSPPAGSAGEGWSSSAPGTGPVSAVRTAALLEGESWSDDLAARLAVALKEELDPPEDLNADAAMRRYLAGVLVKRTLQPLVSG